MAVPDADATLTRTGKQVLTALLAAIAKGRPPINCSAKTKVPDEYFGSKSGVANGQHWLHARC